MILLCPSQTDLFPQRESEGGRSQGLCFPSEPETKMIVTEDFVIVCLYEDFLFYTI